MSKKSKINDLLSKIQFVIYDTLKKFFDELEDYDKLLELKSYIHEEIAGWSIEKLKIVLQLLKLKKHEDVETILSYLEHHQYGWNGKEYNLFNPCICYNNNTCRDHNLIRDSEEATSKAFGYVSHIFLHKKYGGITTYLFGYCIAALFSSHLKLEGIQAPYFLQIACKKNSNAYRLIQEIAHICDVNTGIIEKCNHDYSECYKYDCTTIFPTQSVKESLDNLLYHRDVPVIIEGYENENFYNALLREVANIPTKNNKLGVKDQFNTLPIFICSSLHSHFKNVMSIDLTEIDIEEEHLNKIQEYKHVLASWIYQLVQNPKDYFFQRNKADYNISRRTGMQRQFFYDIDGHINNIRKTYTDYINLTEKDITNIGFLTYFFKHYMEVFKQSIGLTEEMAFTFENKHVKNPEELINIISKMAVDFLFDFHSAYSPTLPMGEINIDANVDADITDPEVKKQIKINGKKYALKIIEYYQAYGLSLRIPNIEFKNDRYVFSVKLLPGADKKKLNLYADEIRRLLGVEVFMPDIRHSSIKIIVSEKSLEENSLIGILDSEEFQKSKMKIPYAVGYDMMGQMVISDIAEFPHLLIGGATGYGKSSALHSLLMSIVYKQKPDKVRLLLLDFGASRLDLFEKAPHMMAPVITEVDKGRKCILGLINIMEQRLAKIESIDEWPSIVCVIDEFPAFIRKLTEDDKDSDELIIDLLERARKVKIHLILATQDATKRNIKIKSTNLSASIAFKCNNIHDSHAIIGSSAATELSIKGAMYFKCYQHEGLKRLQGAFMPPEEIKDTLDNMKFELSDANSELDEMILESASNQKLQDTGPKSYASEHKETHDEKLAKIIMWTLGKNKISNNQIKNKYKIGYDKAQIFIRELEDDDIITRQKGEAKLPREVIPKKLEDIPKKIIELLNDNGYSSDEIINALNKQPVQTGTQSEIV